MAPLGTEAIVEVTTQLLSTDPPKDYCVSHFHFNTGAASPSPANWQALTDAIKGVWFATSGVPQHYGANGGKVVAYNMADPKPRPEKAVSSYTPGSWMTSVSWPRQVALCVSFYAQRNLKNQRGRIFLPINNQWSPIGERPSSATQNSACQLIKSLYDATLALTPSWTLDVYSKVQDQSYAITNVWCNDVWDTQRRRAPKETTRTQILVP